MNTQLQLTERQISFIKLGLNDSNFEQDSMLKNHTQDKLDRFHKDILGNIFDNTENLNQFENEREKIAEDKFILDLNELELSFIRLSLEKSEFEIGGQMREDITILLFREHERLLKLMFPKK